MKIHSFIIAAITGLSVCNPEKPALCQAAITGFWDSQRNEENVIFADGSGYLWNLNYRSGIGWSRYYVTGN
jgi:hypothetical protein